MVVMVVLVVMVVIITITHHQQLSVFICSRFGFFRWNTHSAIAPLEMLGDGSGSSGSRPTTASLGSSATRTTSSGDQSLGLRSAASGSWGDVCSGPVPRPPEPAPPTAMAPAPPREPTLLPPWHLPRAIPGQPPPPLWPPPQCRETPLCHEPTQGQCICCRAHFCTRHFAGLCMRCAAEPLCRMCLAWDHLCWRDSPQEEPPWRDTPSDAVEEQTFAHPVGSYTAALVYAVDRNGRCYPATLQPSSSSDVPQVSAPTRARVPGFPSAVHIPVPNSSASSSPTVHSTVPTQPLGPGGVVSASSNSHLAPAPSLPPVRPFGVLQAA